MSLIVNSVAPLAGAWIETECDGNKKFFKESHPSRVRGLKLWPCLRLLNKKGSHPSRVRGLKRVEVTTACAVFVAPLAGAWIETRASPMKLFVCRSHPSRVRGLKRLCSRLSYGILRRTPRGC